MTTPLESKKIVQRIIKAARDKKAENVVVLEMFKVANFCDYFVILSAHSTRQAAAIGDAITEALASEKIKTSNGAIAAQRESGWILLDFAGVIVHIFYEPMREFYALEHLWQDAPRTKLRSTLK